MPQLTRAEQSRRFVFLHAYAGAVLAAREAALADAQHEHRMWRTGETLEDIIRTAASLLESR